MAFYHGVKTSERSTSLSTTVRVENGVTFAVGTAPVHTVGGKVNKVIFVEDYESAVKELGYSDDWDKYTLCEVIKTHFVLYAVAPVIFVNVLDPEKHCGELKSENFSADSEGVIRLPSDVIADTVSVRSVGGDTYALGTDYTLAYGEEGLLLTVLQGGTITETALTVEYKEIDPSLVSKSDIIGGVSVTDGGKSGLELVDSAFTAAGVVPEIIIAPGFSEDSEVAAVMNSKARAINELFKGKAIIDIDTEAAKNAVGAYQFKNSKSIAGENQILCFPNVALSGKRYHLSTHIAALMALTDSENDGIPSDSPSNKSLQIDSTVLKDGSEISVELSEANRLNSYGIVTALNFTGGFKAWGNYTACYPSNTDVKDYFISVNRMFGFVAKTLIFSYWGKIDGKMTPRFVQSIVDSINIWLNGLTSDGHLLGGRVEFISGENNTADLISGKMRYHVYLTPPSPAVEIDYVLEYDTAYVEALFA